MSNTTTQVRVKLDDSAYINALSLKLSARVLRKIKASEVLHALINEVNGEGTQSIDDVSEKLEHYFRAID